jgi:hypothetical protein
LCVRTPWTVVLGTRTLAAEWWSVQATVRDQAERLHGLWTTLGDKCPFPSSGPQVADPQDL